MIHFNLAAFSIMAPMLLDHLLDCYAHGLKQEIVERTVFIAVIFSSFLIQYVSSYFNYYAIIFMCFYCLMTWVLFAFYVTLHRISPVATSLRVAILGLTLFCWLFITLMGSVYKDPAVITAGIAFRYISVILIIFLQIAITWDLYRNFRESRMKFSSWVSQRNESEQNAFTISIVLCLHIFFHNIFVVSLNNGLEGFQYRTEKFFLAYYPITLLAFLCITLLPGRILKLHAGRLQGDLESKRVFIR